MTLVHFLLPFSPSSGGKNGWSVPNIRREDPTMESDGGVPYGPARLIVDATKASSSDPLTSWADQC